MSMKGETLKMKFRKFITILAIVACAITGQAQNATAIFNKVVQTYRNSGTISASYSTSGSRGTIVMQGSKFRVLAGDFKTWFDGRTQWTYSNATGEVNVTTPTAQEIAAINPIAVASSLQKSYSMSAKSQGGKWVLTLTPRKAGKVKRIVLYVNGKYQLTAARYIAKNGRTQSLTISNYRTHTSYPASTFTFNKKYVPRGTEIVDLR